MRNETIEKLAYRNMRRAAELITAGYENQMEDFPSGSSEHISAENALNNHKSLVMEVYATGIKEGTDDVFFTMKNHRFLGKAKLLAFAEKAVTAMGY